MRYHHLFVSGHCRETFYDFHGHYVFSRIFLGIIKYILYKDGNFEDAGPQRKYQFLLKEIEMGKRKVILILVILNVYVAVVLSSKTM